MIPIYRAKKIDSDEYVIGYYEHIKGARGYENNVIKYNKELGRQFINCNVSIDVSTLAIHFHDMIDSQGNKIFASLREDGKGGDICSYKHYKNTVRYEDMIIWLNGFVLSDVNFDYKVIGIQE